jgi:hypothetical protein
MKIKWKTGTALCALLLLLTLALAGCDFFAALFDPLIGTWTGTYVSTLAGSFSLTVEFKADETFSETMSLSPTPVTIAGTYVDDKDLKTLTVTVTSTSDPAMIPVGTVGVSNYALSTDKKTLTMTSPDGIGTLTKQ